MVANEQSHPEVIKAWWEGKLGLPMGSDIQELAKAYVEYRAWDLYRDGYGPFPDDDLLEFWPSDHLEQTFVQLLLSEEDGYEPDIPYFAAAAVKPALERARESVQDARRLWRSRGQML